MMARKQLLLLLLRSGHVPTYRSFSTRPHTGPKVIVGPKVSRPRTRPKPRPLEVPSIVTESPMKELRRTLADKVDMGERREDVFLPPGAHPEDAPALLRLPNSNIFLGPGAHASSPPTHVEFARSSVKVADCPDDRRPQFALVGRSNAGKSSLLNALVNRKELAQTSKKPGKTQVINHFLINNGWYLVDLPGYGFANAPNEVRTSWSAFTKDFFLRSKTLVSVLLLIDASIPPQKIDLECAEWLGRSKIPVTIVFTKCDKRKKKPAENVKEFLRLLKKSFIELPPWLMTSSVTNQGKEELLLHISQLRNYWNN